MVERGLRGTRRGGNSTPAGTRTQTAPACRFPGPSLSPAMPVTPSRRRRKDGEARSGHSESTNRCHDGCVKLVPWSTNALAIRDQGTGCQWVGKPAGSARPDKGTGVAGTVESGGRPVRRPTSGPVRSDRNLKEHRSPGHVTRSESSGLGHRSILNIGRTDRYLARTGNSDQYSPRSTANPSQTRIWR